jgi:hypothetical protein
MRVFGIVLIVLGFLISLSIVGAIIGVPMMIIGLICVLAGGRHKTTITNVVQVSHGAAVVPGDGDDSHRGMSPLVDHQPVTPRLQGRLKNLNPLPAALPVIEGEFTDQPPTGPSYDRVKWAALVRYDADIARIVAALQPHGQKYVDELASAYLALNDKQYLSMLVQKIVADAQQERAQSQRRATGQS